MKRIRKPIPTTILMTAMLLSFVPPLYGQEKKDTVARELKEVTVVADMQKVSANTATYYPAAKVKRVSSNAIDLLQRMAMSQLRIDPVAGTITTSGGAEAVVFINYQRARQEDIQGLRTTDVRKVEVMDFPSDPRFEGVPHAVNITVQVYEYGGYTKLNDSQTAISKTANAGSVFSKYVYKRMTYDAYLGSDYSSTNHSGHSTVSLYRLKKGDVERTEERLGGENKIWDIPVTFRATYNKKGIQIANTLGFRFNDKSRDISEGALSFRPDATGTGYSYSVSQPAVSRSASWDGAYWFVLPKDWSIYILPSFGYTHTDAYSTYSTTVPGTGEIVNNAEEDGYSLRLNANAYKTFSQKHSLSIHATVSGLINDIDYSGSSVSHVDNSNTEFVGSGRYTYNNGNSTVLSLYGGAQGSVSRVNGVRHSNASPFLSASLTLTPTPKSQYQLGADYTYQSISSYTRSPVILQENELMYSTGNAKLNGNGALGGNLAWLWFPTNSFTMQASVSYLGCYDRMVPTYDLYDGGKSVLHSYINSGDFNRFSLGLNFTLRLFSNSLVLQGSPFFERSMSTGYYSMSHNSTGAWANAQYYAGDFNFSGYYCSRAYAMDIYTGQEVRNASYYYLRVGWNRGSWNLSLDAKNFLRSHYRGQWSDLATPDYRNHTDNMIPIYHAGITLEATYTFGYGKKVARGNEVSGQWGAESAIMH